MQDLSQKKKENYYARLEKLALINYNETKKSRLFVPQSGWWKEIRSVTQSLKITYQIEERKYITFKHKNISHSTRWTRCKDFLASTSPQIFACYAVRVRQLSHLLLHCDFARNVWNHFGKPFGVQGCKPSCVVSWLNEVLSGGGLKGKAKILWCNFSRAIV